MLELVLEDKQIVGGSDSYDALVWMPRRVENLLVKVQAVDADFVLGTRVTSLGSVTQCKDIVNSRQKTTKNVNL